MVKCKNKITFLEFVMRKRRTILIIISIFLMSILGGIVFPLLLDKFIFSNNYPSALSNSDWSGFLGGIWGGIIGGIGTLIAVCITTLDTRDIQEENKKQIAVANYKEKLQSIINTLCSYWEKSTKVLKTVQEISKCKEEIISVDKEMDSISNNLRHSSLTNDDNKVLMDKKETLTYKKTSKIIQIEKLNETNNSLIDSISYEYLLLKLQLSDIECSSDLMGLLNETQIILTRSQQSTDMDSSKLCINNQLIQDRAKQFISEFENRFIKINKEE